MLLVGVACPIDNLSLGTITATVKGGDQEGQAVQVGEHVHLESTTVVVCLSGHQWRFQGTLILERTS